MSEVILMSGSRRHECRALVEAAVIEFRPALQKFSWKICKNKCDVDDLVQDTICTAITKSHLFDPRFKILTWLFTIMRRINIDRFRREEVQNDLIDLEMAEETVRAPNYDWIVHYAKVSDAMGRLAPSKQQAIIQIAHGQGYGSGARACGCDINTLKTRVRRARQELLAQVGDIFAPSAGLSSMLPRI